MINDPQDNVLDILRAMRSDLAQLKEGQQDLRSEMIDLKKQLHPTQSRRAPLIPNTLRLRA